jgi:serine/threonine protein kinase
LALPTFSFVRTSFESQPGGEFYQLNACSRCKTGFFAEGRTCQPEAQLPAFVADQKSQVRVARGTAAGTPLLSLSATSPNAERRLSYTIESITADVDAEGAFELDEDTGALLAKAELVQAGTVIVRVRATDDLTECVTLRGTFINVQPGGCFADLEVVISIVGFVSCPDPTVVYLSPSEDAVTLDYPEPSLGVSGSDIAVTVNRQGRDFGAGEHEVVYTSATLDVGGALTCRFVVTVINGFSFQATFIGHDAFSSAVYDYIVEDSRADPRVLAPQPFTGDILTRDFAYGIESPRGRPFSLALKAGLNARLIISLEWCISGAQRPAESEYTILPVTVTLNGAPDIAVSDTGSGYIADGRCLRVRAQTGLLRAVPSFTAVNVLLPIASHKQRRSMSGDAIGARSRRNDAYVPVAPSVMFFEYRATSGGIIASDPGTMLVLRDIDPPRWAGCPLRLISVPSQGNPLATPAIWSEPTATDNVGVTYSYKTAQPGDTFSYLASPTRVVYTARDAEGLEAVCEFDVVVTFTAAIRYVDPLIDQRFLRQSRQLDLLPVVEETQELLDVFDPALFMDDTNLGNYTALQLRLALPSSKDLVEVRSPAAAEWGQIVVDLRWDIDVENLEYLFPDADITLELEFERFAPRVNGSRAGGGAPVQRLEAMQTLTGAEAHIDAQNGAVRVTGKSRQFNEGFLFGAIVVRANFPLGRSGRALNYVFSSGSTLSVLQRFDEVAHASEGGQPFVLVQDLVPPEVRPCPASMSVVTDAGQGYATVTWDEPAVFDEFRTTMVLTGEYGEMTVPASLTLQPPAQIPLRMPGAAPLTVVYTATDDYGNMAQCRFNVTVRDVEAPTATCVSAARFTLPAGAATVAVPRASWVPTMGDNAPFAPQVVQPTAETLLLSYGVHHFATVVSDAYGNTVNCTTTLEVLDLEPPTITCPSDNRYLGRSGGVEAFWGAPAINDNSGANTVVVNSTHRSGDIFASGETVVVYTVTDIANNTATCNFTIFVAAPAAATGEASSTAIVSGAGAGGALLLLVVCAMAVVLYRHRQQLKRPADWGEVFRMIEQFKDAGDNDGPRVPRELPRSSVRLLDELGRGAFGLVYKGLLEENKMIPAYLVAVKSLHERSSGADRQELLEEAAVMAQFEHANVVRLVGVVTVGKPMLVVLEFMEHGSLKAYLGEHGDSVLAEQKAIFALDCAAGLEHIHDNGFIHRDVSARNVLLASDMRCKIADFGLAREAVGTEETYYRSKNGQLPVRWSAPEALDEHRFTEKTDVWSCGVLFYEIQTKATTPYEGWSNQRTWVEVTAGYRLPQPVGCDDGMYQIILACWAAEPKARPDFTALVQQLKQHLMDVHGRSFEEDEPYLEVGQDAEDADERESGLRSFFSRLNTRRSASINRAVVNPAYLPSPPTSAVDAENAAIYDLGSDEDAVVLPAPQSGTAIMGGLIEEEEEEDEDVSPMSNGAAEAAAESAAPRALENDFYFNTALHRKPDMVELQSEENGFGFDSLADVAEANAPVSPADVGKRVTVQGYSCEGVLRFYGDHKRKLSKRCGVELDAPQGKNNGTVDVCFGRRGRRRVGGWGRLDMDPTSIRSKSINQQAHLCFSTFASLLFVPGTHLLSG